MASIETIGWYSNKPGSQSYPPLFNLFYPNPADFIGIVSNFRSRSAMRQLAAGFRANSDFPIETHLSQESLGAIIARFGARAIAPLARGSFAVTFFFAVLAVLELEGVRLEDI